MALTELVSLNSGTAGVTLDGVDKGTSLSTMHACTHMHDAMRLLLAS